MFDLGLAKDSLNDDLKDLFTDLEAFSLGLVKAIFIKQLAVANEHFSQFAYLAFKVVRRDLIELQAHLLSVILFLFNQVHVSLGHCLHLVADLFHILLLLGRGRPLPVVVIAMVIVLWAVHTSLESIVLVVAPATPTALPALIVIIISAATTTAASASLILIFDPRLVILTT